MAGKCTLSGRVLPGPRGQPGRLGAAACTQFPPNQNALPPSRLTSLAVAGGGAPLLLSPNRGVQAVHPVWCVLNWALWGGSGGLGCEAVMQGGCAASLQRGAVPLLVAAERWQTARPPAGPCLEMPWRTARPHHCPFHAMQGIAPFQHLHTHACSPGRAKGPLPTHPPARAPLLADSDQSGARLIGVEYIISERLFKDLPPEEKKFWHSHRQARQGWEVLVAGWAGTGRRGRGGGVPGRQPWAGLGDGGCLAAGWDQGQTV